MTKTTLCYLSSGDQVLMLYRNKEQDDPNGGKYLGIGGHFEDGETPEQCALREIYEESGLTPTECKYCGIVYFISDKYESEEMHLFTGTVSAVDAFPECSEGTLVWVPKDQLLSLKMWEGDRIFLELLFENTDFFVLSLEYHGDSLVLATLNGQPLELKKPSQN